METYQAGPHYQHTRVLPAALDKAERELEEIPKDCHMTVQSSLLTAMLRVSGLQLKAKPPSLLIINGMLLIIL